MKTFTAPDLAAALALARSEMGPAALVLASREVEGGLGLRACEVTVAVSRSEPRRRAVEEPPPFEATDTVCLHPVLRAAARALVDSGVTPALADRFAHASSGSIGPRSNADGVFRAATRGLAELVRISDAPLRARCVFVVGPPGAGKTTTAAKLAARGVLAARGTTVLAEADLERVGAMEQAAIFSHHLGTGFARIEGPDDLRRALHDVGPDGVVIVDTPGIGRNDGDRIGPIANLREAAPQAEVAVLLPSGLRRDEAAAVLDRFAALRPTAAAFSRIDESPYVGELVSAIADYDVPLAFMTDGHRVPDNLVAAETGRLLALLIRGGRFPAATEAAR